MGILDCLAGYCEFGGPLELSSTGGEEASLTFSNIEIQTILFAPLDHLIHLSLHFALQVLLIPAGHRQRQIVSVSTHHGVVLKSVQHVIQERDEQERGENRYNCGTPSLITLVLPMVFSIRTFPILFVSHPLVYSTNASGTCFSTIFTSNADLLTVSNAWL